MTTATRMRVNLDEGLLEQAVYCPSPHCDERPAGASVELVVIHGISLPPGQFGGKTIEAFFCGTLDMSSHPYFKEIAHLRVSAHLLVKRTGEVVQFVPFTKRAWHAGESSFAGRAQCNDYSIGIELEGTDTTPYEPIQYDRLASIIDALQQAYPAITPQRLVGHSDIAPVRKTDPGPSFDWAYLKGKLA